LDTVVVSVEAYSRIVGGWCARQRAPNTDARRQSTRREGDLAMLYTIAVVLLIAWLLGIVGTYTIGAFVHILLVVAIVLFLVGLLSGRRLA
jgi:Family of unknown function (DUF5670)